MDEDAQALSDDDQRLITFLRDRDVLCPSCQYNLRDLHTPVCPECEHRLFLTVGLQEVRILPLILALIPLSFSGICASLLLVPIILVSLLGGGPMPWHIILIDLFGWISGIVGLVLIHRRHHFLRLPLTRQQKVAAAIWAIHIAAFIVLLAQVLA